MDKKTNSKPRLDGKSLELDKEQLKQSILNFTEQKTEPTDKDLDRYLQKIELLSGVVIDLSKLDVVSNNLLEYAPRFCREFYVQIFRLNSWDTAENGTISKKPPIVGKWTKEIIYGRFNNKVLPTLEYLNPYVRIGLRKHKHHQYLNADGLLKLETFIEDAVQVMKESSTWYEFRVAFYEKFRVPYQVDLFNGGYMKKRD